MSNYQRVNKKIWHINPVAMTLINFPGCRHKYLACRGWFTNGALQFNEAPKVNGNPHSQQELLGVKSPCNLLQYFWKAWNLGFSWPKLGAIEKNPQVAFSQTQWARWLWEAPGQKSPGPSGCGASITCRPGRPSCQTVTCPWLGQVLLCEDPGFGSGRARTEAAGHSTTQSIDWSLLATCRWHSLLFHGGPLVLRCFDRMGFQFFCLYLVVTVALRISSNLACWSSQ